MTALEWTLLLLLYTGTPQERWEVVAERMSWKLCMARGFAELARRPKAGGMRCETRWNGA